MYSTLVKKIISTETNHLNELFTTKGKIYTFLNPVSYLTALNNKNIFDEFDGIFADGSLLVLAIKSLYGKTITRRSFDMTSLAPELLRFVEKYQKSLYIVASKQEQIENAIIILKKKYPTLIFSGFRNGYFSSEKEMNVEIQHIIKQKPDFIIVGMGTLKQEKFLLKVKSAGFQGIGFTCGGFIHQTSTNQINYYPEWINKLNLRFIYRMYKEKHTRKRYIQAAFLFPIKFIFERYFK